MPHEHDLTGSGVVTNPKTGETYSIEVKPLPQQAARPSPDAMDDSFAVASPAEVAGAHSTALAPDADPMDTLSDSSATEYGSDRDSMADPMDTIESDDPAAVGDEDAPGRFAQLRDFLAARHEESRRLTEGAMDKYRPLADKLAAGVGKASPYMAAAANKARAGASAAGTFANLAGEAISIAGEEYRGGKPVPKRQPRRPAKTHPLLQEWQDKGRRIGEVFGRGRPAAATGQTSRPRRARPNAGMRKGPSGTPGVRLHRRR